MIATAADIQKAISAKLTSKGMYSVMVVQYSASQY